MTPTTPSQPIQSGADEPIVFVVDDDDSLRKSLSKSIPVGWIARRAVGLRQGTAAGQFPDVPSCIVLDIRLPGISGLDFQLELARADIHIPIIFMTNYGDIPMTVRAMKAGAIDFLTKPFRDQDMLDAVVAAIEQDRRRRSSDKTTADLRGLFDRLSPREREVMGLVTAGLMNKQVAAETGLVGARSFADLVRMADLLGVRRGKS